MAGRFIPNMAWGCHFHNNLESNLSLDAAVFVGRGDVPIVVLRGGWELVVSGQGRQPWQPA